MTLQAYHTDGEDVDMYEDQLDEEDCKTVSNSGTLTKQNNEDKSRCGVDKQRKNGKKAAAKGSKEE